MKSIKVCYMINFRFLAETNECLAEPCTHGTCIDGLSSYTCFCTSGYEGDNCDSEWPYLQIVISPFPVYSSLLIAVIIRWIRCSCSIKIEINICKTITKNSQKYVLFPVNIDDCLSNLCDNDAACVDGLNDYTCTCTTGYQGHFCSRECTWLLKI